MEQLALTSLIPQTLDEKLKLAEVFSKSGLMPAGLKTPAQLLVALQMGHELNIPPMTAIRNIAVINGRPTLQADLMLAIAIRTGEVEYVDTNDVTDQRAVIKLKRKGFPEHISTFSVEDARRAGLLERGPWKQYLKRMLKARALAFAVRDVFPDVLAGLYTPDEISGGEDGRFDLPAGALNGLPESILPVVQENGLVQAKTPESMGDEPVQNGDRLRPLWKAVYNRCKAIGTSCLDILKKLDPEVKSVNGWMKSAKEQRNFSGLKAFDEALKKFQATSTPTVFSTPGPAVESLPSAPAVDDLPNGAGKVSPPTAAASKAPAWTAARGPGNPHGLTLRASKVLAAIEKAVAHRGQSRFLPDEIPFPGKSGHASGAFREVRPELERAGLVMEAEDHKAFVLICPQPAMALPSVSPDHKAIPGPGGEKILPESSDDSWRPKATPPSQEGTSIELPTHEDGLDEEEIVGEVPPASEPEEDISY